MSDPPRRPLSPELDTMLSVAAIGSYIINFGNLEATVCRLIEWLNGNETPGEISVVTRRLPWTGLLAQLRGDAEGSPVGTAITRLLEEHEIDACGSVRHSLVHGTVTVSQPPNVTINRRNRDGSNPTIIGSRYDIEERSSHVIALAKGLDALLPESYRRNHANLIAGVVGLTTEMALAQGIDPATRGRLPEEWNTFGPGSDEEPQPE